MRSFLRFPRLTVFLGGLSAVLALARDIALSHDARYAADALMVYTCMALVATCALLCSRFFIDTQGVGVSTLFRRRRIHWEQMAALGYLRVNGRRMYLYGMSRRHATFDKLIVHAPFCSPGRFVVPASPRVRAAVCETCPFPPESMFPAHQPVVGKLLRRMARPLLRGGLLLAAGVLAFVTGAAIASYVCRNVMQTSGLLVWCALSALCMAAGIYLSFHALHGVLCAPGVNAQGIRVGFGPMGLSMDWAEMETVWLMRTGHTSGLYYFNHDTPSGHPYIDEAGNRTPARPPMNCLSLPDTHLLLLSTRTYCAAAIKRCTYRMRRQA